MFNIETYLDSLPEDTERIDVSEKGLTYLPNLSRFKNLTRLYCFQNKLTSLPELNEKLEILYCFQNKLTSLPELNEKLEILCCDDNQLTSLPPLKNLQILNCYNNQLSYLRLNEKLTVLYCSGNWLTYLHLNEKLTVLYCTYNCLTSLHLNKNLKQIFCSNNPIYEIINIPNKQILKQLKILNRFRYLYYSLKFKKRFRDWLWVRIREPKIREKYSHDYLVANLHEDTDLDKLLDHW